MEKAAVVRVDRTPTGQARRGIRQVAAGATIRLRNSDRMSRPHLDQWGRDTFHQDLIDYHCGDPKMPMKNPPHPGETIRYACLEPLGLSVTAGAQALGVNRKQLSDVVNGKAGISAEMAIRLSESVRRFCKGLVHDTSRVRFSASHDACRRDPIGSTVAARSREPGSRLNQ